MPYQNHYKFFKLIYFNGRLITLQYCSGFCHKLTWISHGCTYVPHPESPSQLPPHPILQGHPSAPALSALFQASNLDWSSVSPMVIYMFQCYSLKSSHPRLLLTASLKHSSSASACSLTFQTLPRHASYAPATLGSPPSIKYFLSSGSFSTWNSFPHIYL